MHLRTDDTDPSDDFDDANTQEHARPPASFRERHALKILGAIMAVALGGVMLAQVAC